MMTAVTHFQTTPIVRSGPAPDLTVVLAHADRFEFSQSPPRDFWPYSAQKLSAAPYPQKMPATRMGAAPCGSARHSRRATSTRSVIYTALSKFRRLIDRAMQGLAD